MASPSAELLHPHPLRPYVIPPQNHSFSSPRSPLTRDFLADLDIPSDYLESPDFGKLVRDVTNVFAMKYLSIFSVQPFEVAKTVMQVQYLPKRETGNSASRERGQNILDNEDSNDTMALGSDEDPPYFQSSGISPPSSPRFEPRRRPVRCKDDERSVTSTETTVRPWEIPDKAKGFKGILGSLWTQEGAWGLWKGQNLTFIYSVLGSGMESWLSSLLAATFALPDPALFDILDSPTPGLSLIAAITSSVITSFILAPVDMYRVASMLVPTSPSSNKSAPKIMNTPVVIPTVLLIPTFFHSALPITASSLFTLTLRPYLHPWQSPAASAALTFFSSFVELAVRLPLEAVLRRGQVQEAQLERTVVRIGAYEKDCILGGVVGTLWKIGTEEEGGAAGLFRGWRVGFWGLMGTWSLRNVVLGGEGDVEF